MNIGVFANLAKPAAASTLADLARTAKELEVTLVTCDRATARLAPGARHVAPARFGRTVDVLLSLGGDGTVLQSVRALDGSDAPILGINLGNLGFLTSVPDTQAVAALRAIASGAYELSDCPLLDARLFRGPRRKPVARARALNDVVMGWGTSPRATMIEVEVDRQPVASFVCDGLIVATPVGSTGHALSAGGPILHRETAALVIEPICPHTLSNRPIVVGGDSRIEVRVRGDDHPHVRVSCDGQPDHPVDPDQRLYIRKSDRPVRLLHPRGHDHYAILPAKLGWGGHFTR